jgi:hypothetical protein
MAKKHAFTIQHPSQRVVRDGTIEDYIESVGARGQHAEIITELELKTKEYASTYHYDGVDMILVEEGREHKIVDYANTLKQTIEKYSGKEMPIFNYSSLGLIDKDKLELQSSQGNLNG